MLIGIDANEANNREKVGIGQYAFQVLWHIYKCQMSNVKCQSARWRIKFKIYLKDEPLNQFPPETAWWQYIVFGPKYFWTQAALPLRLTFEKDKPDVFLTLSHYAPRFSSGKYAIAIMDLSFIFYPEMFRKKDLMQLKSWTEYSVKKAEKIFTISYSSKKDIVSYYKISEEKVIVTYPGYDSKNFKFQISNFKLGDKKIRDKFQIRGDYILFVGTLQPRKNIVRLIEAFNLLIQHNKDIKLQLVIAGKKGWLFENIFESVRRFGLEDKVIFTDYISDKDLPDLYRNARCLILPSLYEGFGLPVIEAMACGCPVVVSNVSSLPEIVGKDGILIDPYNVESIEKGISTICYDKSKRELFINSGLERVKSFSWKNCAETTLDEIVKLGNN